MKELVRFTFRIPETLYQRIQESAEKNYRSLNAEIIVAIQDYLGETDVIPKRKQDE